MQSSQDTLSAISLEEVSQILQEEVLKLPSIASIEVAVTGKSVVLQATNQDVARRSAGFLQVSASHNEVTF